MTIRIFPLAFLVALLLFAGCGSHPAQQTVERVRSEVAAILKKDAATIDVSKPLVAQGADELDTPRHGGWHRPSLVKLRTGSQKLGVDSGWEFRGYPGAQKVLRRSGMRPCRDRLLTLRCLGF